MWDWDRAERDQKLDAQSCSFWLQVTGVLDCNVENWQGKTALSLKCLKALPTLCKAPECLCSSTTLQGLNKFASRFPLLTFLQAHPFRHFSGAFEEGHAVLIVLTGSPQSEEHVPYLPIPQSIKTSLPGRYLTRIKAFELKRSVRCLRVVHI